MRNKSWRFEIGLVSSCLNAATILAACPSDVEVIDTDQVLTLYFAVEGKSNTGIEPLIGAGTSVSSNF